eukprot:1660889-Pleurochrysis_carterae.AAC.2
MGCCWRQEPIGIHECDRRWGHCVPCCSSSSIMAVFTRRQPSTSLKDPIGSTCLAADSGKV